MLDPRDTHNHTGYAYPFSFIFTDMNENVMLDPRDAYTLAILTLLVSYSQMKTRM